MPLPSDAGVGPMTNHENNNCRNAPSREVAIEQALYDSEEKYRSLFNSIDEGFCIVEVKFDGDTPVDYRFLEYNRAFEAQTGLIDAQGRWMRELAPDHEQHWFELYGSVARTGESIRFQNAAKALGRYYDVNAFRVGLPEQRRVAILFKDITERKLAQDQLREANRRKDEYLAMLGHELRNPLAAIQHASELIECDGDDASIRAMAAEVLKRQSHHMARLVDGLLEVSRIVRGKLGVEPVTLDLREVVDDALVDRSHEFADAGVELVKDVPDEPVWARVNPVRIAQVLGNLIGNSVKFTPMAGTINVALYARNGQAHIAVRDTGGGIAPDELEHIFEPFFQHAQEIDRGGGGLGLGLAVAKGLVELHSGTIEAHSAGAGQGAEFIIRLPLSAPPAPARPPEASAERKTRHILLIEDNQDVAHMLRLVLQSQGHQVTVVPSGARGLEALRGGGTDIVLCDIGLPHMSGYDFARMVRADETLRELPLVAVTGYGESDARRRSAQAGFDAHLTKPVDFDDLNDVLSRL